MDTNDGQIAALPYVLLMLQVRREDIDREVAKRVARDGVYTDSELDALRVPPVRQWNP